MDVIALWSGGKDSCLACYKAQQQGHRIRVLLNFIQPGAHRSLSHGVPALMVAAQAELTGIPLVQCEVSRGGYEQQLKTVIAEWKQKGVEGIVFGDIYLNEHREWLDRVCKESDIRALYPLWGNDTRELVAEFIGYGFNSVIVAAREDCLSEQWLGRSIDPDFITDLANVGLNIDPCGESGEFHTFVLSGPLLGKRMTIKKYRPIHRDGHYFLDISEWEAV